MSWCLVPAQMEGYSFFSTDVRQTSVLQHFQLKLPSIPRTKIQPMPVTERPHLEVIEGPRIELDQSIFAGHDDQPITLGRAIESQICLPDRTVSRRHALIRKRGEQWFVRDLGSRHGTFLNAVALTADQLHRLQPGDLLRIGPWTFRFAHDETADFAETMVTMTDATADSDSRIVHVSALELAEHRLHLILDGAARINRAENETELAHAVIESVLAGTSFEHAAFLREVGDGFEVVAWSADIDPGNEHRSKFTYSQSLLEAASTGQVARLTSDNDSPVPLGQSITQLGITDALCAPIKLGSAVAAYLYLDARESKIPIHADAADFCQAIAGISGLALEKMKRVELEIRQQQLLSDLEAARQAQELIVPATEGEIAGLRYAMQMQPGSFVAGDLFDVISLDDNNTAVVLGDVTGEGIGAAILMASAQASLHAALLTRRDPAAALNDLNDYVCRHGMETRFITRFISMWVGIFNHQDRTLRYVDAGHGHWLRWKAPGRVDRPDRPGGTLIGIDPQLRYETAEISFDPNERIVLFSDGMIEQPDAAGVQFSHDRVAQVIEESTSVAGDVERIVTAVKEHAGRESLSDDATVASIELT